MKTFTVEQIAKGYVEGKRYVLGSVDIIPVGTKPNGDYVVHFEKFVDGGLHLLGTLEGNKDTVVRCEAVG